MSAPDGWDVILPFRDLTPARHAGLRARFTEHDGTVRDGVLSFAGNPVYPRLKVRHWYLVIPSGIPQFKTAALSLQWLPSDTMVELLSPDEETP